MTTSLPATLSRRYAISVGLFLALQGSSTLAARLLPAFDEAFPALLAQTRMVPSHSLLHLSTAAAAGLVLRWGGPLAAMRFAAGFGVFYIALALAGIASGSELCLGLQAFDHPFHILLGSLGLAAAATDGWRGRRRPPTAAGAPLPVGRP